MTDIEELLQLLPKYVIVAKTPEYVTDSMVMDQVQLQARDVVYAFLSLQRQAIEEASKRYGRERRDLAVAKIRRMVHFDCKSTR